MDADTVALSSCGDLKLKVMQANKRPFQQRPAIKHTRANMANFQQEVNTYSTAGPQTGRKTDPQTRTAPAGLGHRLNTD